MQQGFSCRASSQPRDSLCRYVRSLGFFDLAPDPINRALPTCLQHISLYSTVDLRLGLWSSFVEIQAQRNCLIETSESNSRVDAQNREGFATES